jgi:hypothetical protein
MKKKRASDSELSGKENGRVKQNEEVTQDKSQVMIPLKTVQTIIRYTLGHKSKAAAAQRKPADDVNRGREWEGGLVLEKGMVGVLNCPKKRNALIPPYFPVEIIEVITFQQGCHS